MMKIFALKTNPLFGGQRIIMQNPLAFGNFFGITNSSPLRKVIEMSLNSTSEMEMFLQFQTSKQQLQALKISQLSKKLEFSAYCDRILQRELECIVKNIATLSQGAYEENEISPWKYEGNEISPWKYEIDSKINEKAEDMLRNLLQKRNALRQKIENFESKKRRVQEILEEESKENSKVNELTDLQNRIKNLYHQLSQESGLITLQHMEKTVEMQVNLCYKEYNQLLEMIKKTETKLGVLKQEKPTNQNNVEIYTLKIRRAFKILMNLEDQKRESEKKLEDIREICKQKNKGILKSEVKLLRLEEEKLINEKNRIMTILEFNGDLIYDPNLEDQKNCIEKKLKSLRWNEEIRKIQRAEIKKAACGKKNNRFLLRREFFFVNTLIHF